MHEQQIEELRAQVETLTARVNELEEFPRYLSDAFAEAFAGPLNHSGMGEPSLTARASAPAAFSTTKLASAASPGLFARLFRR